MHARPEGSQARGTQARGTRDPPPESWAGLTGASSDRSSLPALRAPPACSGQGQSQRCTSELFRTPKATPGEQPCPQRPGPCGFCYGDLLVAPSPTPRPPPGQGHLAVSRRARATEQGGRCVLRPTCPSGRAAAPFPWPAHHGEPVQVQVWRGRSPFRLPGLIRASAVLTGTCSLGQWDLELPGEALEAPAPASGPTGHVVPPGERDELCPAGVVSPVFFLPFGGRGQQRGS